MKQLPSAIRRAALFALLITGFITVNSSGAHAQGVAGGTTVSNRVAVTYTEPAGATVNTFSNTVTVTVQNVTGLVITPDAGSAPGVNAGASAVTRTLTISNTGNINESIVFGAGGASLIVTGPVTVTSGYVDVNNNNVFDAGDINIRSATGPLSLNFGASVNVIVQMDISPSATVGQAISVQLGTASANAPSHDNVPAAGAAAGAVKTTGSTGINGDLEARGDLSFTVTAAGSVLIGPQGQPAAVGPTDNNDDYTNKTMTQNVAVPFGGNVTGSQQLVFINTVRNAGAAADNITLTLRAVPGASFVNSYEISTDGGATFQPFTTATPVTINVPATTNFDVRIRLTTPLNISVLTGFPATIRATSGITPQNFNETIDRMWTGFVRADKSVAVTNSTGIGSATDAVPGAVMEYTIVYTNVTATVGTGNVNLTATNVVLTEDGNSAPNNWAATTNHVAGSASDTLGGAITGDVAGSSVLTDTIPSLAPAQSGTFKFRRVIR